jgi:carbon-monoxide dehydrogenase large subunit
MDYALPRATDFPRFELAATVTPTPVNPLGAKGVGEAGTLGSTPCIVSAAVDALGEFGVKHIDMMLRPEKLWRIINGPRTGAGEGTGSSAERGESGGDRPAAGGEA